MFNALRSYSINGGDNMNTYVTAEIIKQLREKKGLTQSGLAKIIGVSDKAVSKWETGKGLPDISLIEPLSAALSVSTWQRILAPVNVQTSRKRVNIP